jgi:hypothetical protein
MTLQKASRIVAREGARPLTAVASGYVYGDSTPFPYAVDYVEIVRSLVVCAVSLMKAQDVIDGSRNDERKAREHHLRLRGDLEAMVESVRGALSSGAAPRRLEANACAERLVTMTWAATQLEARNAQERLDKATTRAEAAIADARRQAAVALGHMLARHDLPGTSYGFRVFASGDGYGAEALATLPGGVRATFDASLPERHPWRSLRRVADVRRGVRVTLPRKTGVFAKRISSLPLTLDPLTILGASLDGSGGAILLGKSERAGTEHSFDIDFSGAATRVSWRGADESMSVELAPDDVPRIVGLLRAIEEATRPIVSRRGTMTEATVNGAPFAEAEPGDACVRLVSLVAPVAREIARRSGAPGELVLRRNVGAGRRDEVFLRTEELLEQIETLPPRLRDVFVQLELEGVPRSARVPVRALPLHEEVSASVVVASP